MYLVRTYNDIYARAIEVSGVITHDNGRLGDGLFCLLYILILKIHLRSQESPDQEGDYQSQKVVKRLSGFIACSHGLRNFSSYIVHHLANSLERRNTLELEVELVLDGDTDEQNGK